MDAKSLIEIMKGNLQGVRQQKVEQLPIENIQAWITALEKFVESHPDEEPTAQQKDLQQRQWEAQLAHYNAQSQSSLESFKSTIQFGLMALKTSMLINGGAVIALLAFIGHIWDSEKFIAIQSPISFSLFLFFLGVLVSAIATALSYFAQGYYSKNNYSKGSNWRMGAIVFVVFSYLFFFVGGYLSLQAFEAPLHDKTILESFAEPKIIALGNGLGELEKRGTDLIEKYQTLIVGFLGFASVICTLWVNAKLIRNQQENERNHEREAIREALLAELNIIGSTLKQNLELEYSEGRDAAWVPTDPLDSAYRTFLPKIGKLTEKEIKKIMLAYLTFQQHNANLFLIGKHVSEMPRHIHIPPDKIENMRGMQQNVLDQVMAAIQALDDAKSELDKKDVE